MNTAPRVEAREYRWRSLGPIVVAALEGSLGQGRILQRHTSGPA